MTELSFAKSFLSTLDSRPSKIAADHVENPRTYPARSAYILPKMAKPLAKRQKLSPGSENSVSVVLKSVRNPPLDITLSTCTPNTSILSLKEEISRKEDVDVGKIRILYKKRPVSDAKVLKDLLEEGQATIEFAVMIIGGVGKRDKEEEEDVPVAQGESGVDTLGKEEFWADLKGFLVQRVRDEGVAEKAHGVFRMAWEERR
ncbi:hypothetical protein B7494_g5531 [Chlorociboria aeruginascens]|nr:hypothetical protein B7494_g5531 [Chlorociboria aeruginascens]